MRPAWAKKKKKARNRKEKDRRGQHMNTKAATLKSGGGHLRRHEELQEHVPSHDRRVEQDGEFTPII